MRPRSPRSPVTETTETTESEEVDGIDSDARLDDEADGPDDGENEAGPKRDNHGAAVSAAAHDKIDDGVPHGKAVSEVARDRSTLPPQAQDQARGPRPAGAQD